MLRVIAIAITIIITVNISSALAHGQGTEMARCHQMSQHDNMVRIYLHQERQGDIRENVINAYIFKKLTNEQASYNRNMYDRPVRRIGRY